MSPVQDEPGQQNEPCRTWAVEGHACKWTGALLDSWQVSPILIEWSSIYSVIYLLLDNCSSMLHLRGPWNLFPDDGRGCWLSHKARDKPLQCRSCHTEVLHLPGTAPRPPVGPEAGGAVVLVAEPLRIHSPQALPSPARLRRKAKIETVIRTTKMSPPTAVDRAGSQEEPHASTLCQHLITSPGAWRCTFLLHPGQQGMERSVVTSYLALGSPGQRIYIRAPSVHQHLQHSHRGARAPVPPGEITVTTLASPHQG